MFWTDSNGVIHLNFKEAEAKAKTMDNYALRFAAEDALEAARNMPDCPKAGAWEDEAYTYLAELQRRF
jgi:hypothetical protein